MPLQGPVFEAVVNAALRRGGNVWLWRLVAVTLSMVVAIVCLLATDDHTHLFLTP